jgi:hypothetical protein
MPISVIKSVSDSQLAANRANAAHSTGPRSPEGKARSAQNARKHGFTASALETGFLTTCMNMALGGSPDPIDLLTPELVGDLEVTRIQNRNVCLAAGFHQMTRTAQCDRDYRRAVEDFDRLKSLRHEIPNEPISDPDPLENTPLPAHETNPISAPTDSGTAGNLVAGDPTPIGTRFPQPTDPDPTSNPIGFVPQNAASEARDLPPALVPDPTSNPYWLCSAKRRERSALPPPGPRSRSHFQPNWLCSAKRPARSAHPTPRPWPPTPAPFPSSQPRLPQTGFPALPNPVFHMPKQVPLGLNFLL